MNNKAQSGLEYLLTYGWTLILIAAVIGVLVFIVSSPASTVTFSSSDPTKIMIKAGAVSGSDAKIIVQNITGGNIEVANISVTGGYSVTDCTLNGEALPPAQGIPVRGGSEIRIECSNVTEGGSGTITVDYTDYAGLPRTVVINGSGSLGSGTPSCPTTGSGTVGDPYIPCDCAGLQAMKDDLAAYYELGSDIDCSVSSTWNAGAGFEPIGSTNDFDPFIPFVGSFDGKGYEITGLYINRPSADEVGLFGLTDTGAEIKNIGLTAVNITGSRVVGALVGYNVDTDITNSYSSGSVSGWVYIGGLFGNSSFSAITNSYSSAIVSASGSIAGGLVGNGGGSITRSYFSGSVSGNNRVGGLVGNNSGFNITNSYSSGSASGTDRVGGLVGDNWESVTNSYSSGTVSGSTNVDGLVGINRDYSGASCGNNFWDTDVSPLGASPCGTGRTTVEMKQQATYTGWNFSTIWDIQEDVTYPFLR